MTTPAPDSAEQITTRTETSTVIGGLPLRLSFEPDAIREHFEADDGFEHLDTLSDTDLAVVGEIALCDDRLYRVFHEVLVAALTEQGHGPRHTTDAEAEAHTEGEAEGQKGVPTGEEAALLDGLTEDQYEALDEIVHDVASRIASNVNNSGDQQTWLHAQGWTTRDIQIALGLDQHDSQGA